MFRKRLFLVLGGLAASTAVVFAIAVIRYSSRCSVSRASCAEHRLAGCSLDGNYNLRVGSRVIDATCNMSVDGGGWTLVANYLHRAKTTASTRPLMDRLPLLKGEKLGDDENGTDAWGHASAVTLSVLPFHEARFFCQTSAHQRKLDFIVSSNSCLNYFRTGKGACLGTNELRAEFRRGNRALNGSDGRLPLTADKGHADQGDNALVDFPFFIDWRENWSIGGLWQCDDTQTGDPHSTRHQVWVR